MASLARTLATQGLALPTQGATVLGSTHAQVAAMPAGVGIGFVSSWAVAGLEGVVIIPGDGLNVRRTLSLAYEQDRLTSPAAQAFVAFVREWAAGREAG